MRDRSVNSSSSGGPYVFPYHTPPYAWDWRILANSFRWSTPVPLFSSCSMPRVGHTGKTFFPSPEGIQPRGDQESFPTNLICSTRDPLLGTDGIQCLGDNYNLFFHSSYWPFGEAMGPGIPSPCDPVGVLPPLSSAPRGQPKLPEPMEKEEDEPDPFMLSVPTNI